MKAIWNNQVIAESNNTKVIENNQFKKHLINAIKRVNIKPS